MLKWIRYSLEAFFIIILFTISKLLGLRASSWVFGKLFRSLLPLTSVRKRALENLQRALPERAKEHEEIIKDMCENLGRIAGEYAHLKTIRKRIENGTIPFEGKELMIEAQQNKKPILMYSAHFGNWELTSPATSAIKVHAVGVYRAPNNPVAHWFTNFFRQNDYVEMLSKGTDGAKGLIRALKKGKSACLLVDQKMNNGIPIPFFGIDAMTAPALAQLALKNKTSVVPYKIERIKGIDFKVTLGPALFSPPYDKSLTTEDIMTHINADIESWIREKPEQWFWIHHRWPK